jgi:hypothetical protein
MPERALGAFMRLLLLIVGLAASLAGVVVAATEVVRLARGSSAVPTLAAAVVAVLATLGRLQLVRGARRGRIQVRRTKFHSTGQHDR